MNRTRLGLWTACAIVLAGVLWLVGLALGPSTKQHWLFFSKGAEWYCDYRMPRNCAEAECVYWPDLENRLDACYPPIAYDLVRLFPRDIQKGGLIFSLFGGIVSLAGLLVLIRAIFGTDPKERVTRVAAFLSVALGYPFLFALNVSNQMLLAAAGVFVFMSSLGEDKGRTLRTVGLIGLSLSIALKITPGLFTVLLLKDRKWKDFVVVGILSSSLIFVPFLWHGGWTAFRGFLECLQLHADMAGIRDYWGAVGVDRAIRLALGMDIESVRASYCISRALNVLCGVGCLAILFFESSRMRSVVLLSVALMLLPGASFAYTGMLLVPAYLLWISEACISTRNLLVALAWIAVFASLQIPVGGGSVNRALAAIAVVFLVACDGRSNKETFLE